MLSSTNTSYPLSLTHRPYTIQYNTIQYNTILCHAMPCHAMRCNYRRCLLGSGPPDIPDGLPIIKGLPKPIGLLSPALSSPKSARSQKPSPHPTLTSPPGGGGAGFLSPGAQTQYTFGTAGTLGWLFVCLFV